MPLGCGAGSHKGACLGPGGDREGREERAPSAKQPAGEPGDATGRRPLHAGTKPL